MPRDSEGSEEFEGHRAAALAWIEPYYDGEHLARAGEWLLEIAPDAPEPLVIAALLHDMERAIPGGPVLDKQNARWDDPEYNRAHSERSAAVVAGWLVGRGASQEFVEGVLPIREHELGGSPEGDLLQAADSLSWLDVNAKLARRWIDEGQCDLPKARAKLQWMYDRIRHERAREIARPMLDGALAELEA